MQAVNAIQQVGAQLRSEMADLAQQTATILPAGHSAHMSEPSFANTFIAAINGVDDKQVVADNRMKAVDSGESDDLVGAMMASQEASLSFSMLTQVRNKVVGAVDDLLKMPL